MCDDDEFQVVKRKKAAKRKFKRDINQAVKELSLDEISSTGKDDILGDINKSINEIRRSTFFTDFKDTLKSAGLLVVNEERSTAEACSPTTEACSPATEACSPATEACSTATEARSTATKARSTATDTSSTGSEIGDSVTAATSKSGRHQGAALCPQQLVCYGIGKFASDVVARYQLSLFLILRDDLKIGPGGCFVYDPVLSPVERDVVISTGCQLLQINEEGKRRVETPTLFFMPHCGRALYNNLLWANWTPGNLGKLAILGNSFSHMQLSTPSRVLLSEATYVLKILPHVREARIRNSFHHTDVFNDLSLHVPLEEALRGADHKFWRERPEPQYTTDTSDIIANSQTAQIS